MGVDDALDYWRAHSDEFDAILMDENGTVYVTDGIADRCSLLEKPQNARFVAKSQIIILAKACLMYRDKPFAIIIIYHVIPVKL